MAKNQSQSGGGKASEKSDQLLRLQKDLARKFKSRKMVFGQGKPAAEIMIVGEALEPDEEKNQKLLVGATGKVFDQLLKEHGLRKSIFYITNAVKYRPENVLPSPKEVKQSSSFLKQEMKIIEPKLIIALGSIALRGLSVKLPLANIRGRMIRFGDMNLFATHHPSAVVKNPDLHIEMSADFHKLKNIIENLHSVVPA